MRLIIKNMADSIETFEQLLACRADEIDVERHLRTFWSREEVDDVLLYDMLIEAERMDEDSVLALIKIFEHSSYDDMFWRLMSRCTGECLFRESRMYDDEYCDENECICIDLIYNYLVLAAGRLDLFGPVIPIDKHPRYMDAAIGGGHVDVIKYLLDHGLGQYPGLYEDMIRQVVPANKWECFVYVINNPTTEDYNMGEWILQALTYKHFDMLKYILESHPELRDNRYLAEAITEEVPDASIKWMLNSGWHWDEAAENTKETVELRHKRMFG